MKDLLCVVEVGMHEKPHWKDRLTGIIVCNRHKYQYDTSGLGPFVWEGYPLVTRTITCIRCNTVRSATWWKCCPVHTTAQGVDVVCQSCASECLSSKEKVVKPPQSKE